MGNPFFENQNRSNFQQTQQPQQLDLNKLYNEFKQNPSKYLSGLNLPPELQTPEQIVRYLAQNGRIPPLIQRQVYSMVSKR
jgi:spore coat protein CotF